MGNADTVCTPKAECVELACARHVLEMQLTSNHSIMATALTSLNKHTTMWSVNGLIAHCSLPSSARITLWRTTRWWWKVGCSHSTRKVNKPHLQRPRLLLMVYLKMGYTHLLCMFRTLLETCPPRLGKSVNNILHINFKVH